MKRDIVQLLFVFCCLTSSSISLNGQDINLRFQHITSDNGLSQNTVDGILQDSRGFMWFCTWNGLNRYDGYNILVYKSGAQNTGLSSNFVYSICEDKNGNLWIGTRNGLNKFDYLQNKFTHYFHEEGNPNSISDNWINALYCDSEGKIWAGTASNGLDCIVADPTDPEHLKVRHYSSQTGNTNFLPDNHINSVIEDHKKNIWIGTNNGAVRINNEISEFKVYKNDLVNGNSLSYNYVSSIFEDRNGNIWIGTQYGLNKLDPETDTFHRYYFNPYDPQSISHSFINDITEDPEGNILVGTLGGLNQYNPAADDFKRFPVDQNDDYSLNNEFINTIYTDRQGNVWIGTDKGGVNKYNIHQKPFGYFIHQPNENSLSSNTINSLFDEPSILWVGTAGGGLNQYDKSRHTFATYKHNPLDSKSLSSDFVTSILRDDKKNLWVGTWGGGLNKANSLKGNGTFKKYLPDENKPNSICNVYVSSLWEDEEGFLMVGTVGGLDMFFPETESFTHIASNTSWKHHITEVGCLLKDKNNYYWIGTRLGLFRMRADKLGNLTDDDITLFLHRSGDSSSLPGNYVTSLFEDTSGTIWVGTYGSGLAKVEEGEKGDIRFTSFTEEDGLANNVVYAILEDGTNNLWLSTDNGLSKFDKLQNKFKNYYVTDGLQSNQFYWSAAYKNENGKMFFGGINGVNFFYPDSIKDDAYLPKVSITDFKIFNSTVNTGIWNNKKVILDRSISETQQIRLSYKENVFSFEFSALSYFLPEKIHYAYKMVGVDNDWVYVPSTRRFASYTNLEGGEYTFLVKASNSDGIWNERPTQLKIIVTPPVWTTAPFKILLFVFVGLVVVMFFMLRTRNLRNQKKKLELLVKERTSQIWEQKELLEKQALQLTETNHQLAHRQELIEGQKNQLEQQNREILTQRDKLLELNKRVKLVNQLKLRFFTNISHEFRTPLTLILGPIEQLLKSWRGDEDSRYSLQLINRNAQRLLHLINQLMDFRKIETGKLQLKVARGNIVEFVEGIFSLFAQLAKQRQIEYSFCVEKPLHRIDSDCWFDHEKLENVVFNLLSNAFKFTPENGRISLSVNIVEISENGEKIFECKVSDNGIGIEPEHQAHIFKRFYQVDAPRNTRQSGSGIGLSLAYELIKAHHGKISLKSTPGKGSSFEVKIPCSRGSFQANEIFDNHINYHPYGEHNASNHAVALGGMKNSVESLHQKLLSLTKEIHTEQSKDHDNANVTDCSDKPTILVAEDNYDLRKFISLFLQKKYRVIETENGKIAYEKAKVHNPKLVISDIMMPEMDGLELCSRIKNDIITSHIPVILLTAKSSVEHWIKGLETGADDYIPKPFNISLLEARIQNIINTRYQLKRLFSSDMFAEPSKMVSTSVDEQFLRKSMKVVEEHYSNPSFGVEDFVEKMAVSRSLLHKKLSAITGHSACDFITSFRLKKSTQLLKAQSGNISEIAYDVGFNDPKYFSRIFKKYFGVSPSEYLQIGQESQ